MELTVTELNGNSQRLTVDHNLSVGELKQLISQLFNVNPSQQRLSTNNGQRIILDNDSRRLSEYGVTSGSTIALFKIEQVFVRNENGVTSTYEVNPNETVDQLQQKIFHKERVPVDQQRLDYNDSQLESGRMLQDYDITDLSTIHMTLRLRGG